MQHRWLEEEKMKEKERRDTLQIIARKKILKQKISQDLFSFEEKRNNYIQLKNIAFYYKGQYEPFLLFYLLE